MKFSTPDYFFVLLVIPVVLGVVFLLRRRRDRYPVAYTNLELLAGLAPAPRFRARRLVAPILLVLALASAATALAQPKTSLSEPDQNAIIVMLVDVSGSMRANDVVPTRLQAAVVAMQTFLTLLPPQFKVGLLAFSDTPQPMLSPTTNRSLLRQAVSYLEPEAGTALGDGLVAAIKMVESSLRTGGYVRTPGQYVPAAIVLLSDGAQNRGTVQPYTAALEAKKAGIRVDGIAFGTPNGKVSFGFGAFANEVPVPPSPATVSMIASTTGGNFYTAETAAKAASVYRTLGSSIGRTKKEVPISSWFAGAAALCLLLAVGAGRFLGDSLP